MFRAHVVILMEERKALSRLSVHFELVINGLGFVALGSFCEAIEFFVLISGLLQTTVWVFENIVLMTLASSRTCQE